MCIPVFTAFSAIFDTAKRKEGKLELPGTFPSRGLGISARGRAWATKLSHPYSAIKVPPFSKGDFMPGNLIDGSVF
ncbi:MAG: hypothetical protein C4519_12565 [Desulfobacteraceae bacterium]|nr:MAG: hypothetical protein C4519_12565 [Desulfobacteraceae bacterium]